MENKGLLKLPETWHIKLTKQNAEAIKSYFEGFRQYDVGCAFGMVNGEIKSRIAGHTHGMGREITFADFKRLVLGENNHEDYGVLGSEELKHYFFKNEIHPQVGDNSEFIYFKTNKGWKFEWSKLEKQTLPLNEYLNLIEEPMEKKDNEITIVQTWETVYFKTEKATVELILNHEKKTFDLQTAREEMVSFKSDTIEVARERLKCIESALDYAEKHLNQ